ncbi:MAG: valine--tRNA ligase [Pseudomonadota bacterium]
MLDSRFDPSAAEARLYKRWEELGCFTPSMDTAAEPYCIVIPPPNVTGVLHMGHALNHTLQDVLVRFERMRGKNVLWQPGTDHAGIATQMVVERELAKEGKKRTDLTRDEFTAKVWQWKAQSGGQIVEQDKRLGVSADWSRERFTMDEGLSAAVRKVFVQLYNEGLIYRDKRLVNWDPHFQTAISDLEVENRETPGHMWHFKYPLAGGETYEYMEKDEDGNVTLRETRDYISIATTRPETMLGDGAVAVHPEDARYAPIVGKLCEIPVGPKEHRRLIPIITDEYPDPDFGSGAVKITGAHDFNDYQVAKRAGIPMYALMDERGAMRADGAPYAQEAAAAKKRVDTWLDLFDPSGAGRFHSPAGETAPEDVSGANLVPDAYRGLDRFEARARVIADITADGNAVMVEGEDGAMVPLVEDKVIMQPFGDRSGVVIEPMLTDQWFVNAEELSKEARAAVADGRTDFVPENWSKTYFNWLDNIEPWCISRQLWWGHRIPVWYGRSLSGDPNTLVITYNEQLGPVDGRQIFCASSESEALELAAEYARKELRLDEVDAFVSDESTVNRIDMTNSGQVPFQYPIVQDPDVLDTWFSSALWPFSTLGWPDKTKELETFYPGAVLVTAFDIIFFWVARMMMMGLKFGPKGADSKPMVPFKHVYIHALVLDEKGQKMSKSKGNAMDPLELIDEYGADALRFTMARLAGMGRNIRLSRQAVEGNRNFGTKLWNAARFCQMNECANWDGELDPAALTEPVNQWIAGEVAAAFAETTAALEAYRFDDGAGAAYKFVWNTFCDWYLELIKPLLNGEDEEAKAETRRVAGWTLDQILKLLHPFMPFITEELWGALAEHGPARGDVLMRQSWPRLGSAYVNPAAAAEMDWVCDLISEIRSFRADLGVPAGAKVPMTLVGAPRANRERLTRHHAAITARARLETARAEPAAPEGSVTTVVGGASVALRIADLIDVAEAKARLDKEVAGLNKELAGLSKKLANPNFIAKAPEDIVAENRQRLADGEVRVDKLAAARAGLDAL